jgi:hypothetical protein
MSTTTPLFGWVVPTSSDLVKNGAVAIETLGDSIDSSMGDLLGGTTGQVLSKTSNTDMDFTWTTAAPTIDFAAGKNKFLNGDYNINQRIFTSTTTTGTYGFDRQKLICSGGTSTYSAQTFTAGTAPVAGYESKNFARLVTSSQSAGTDFAALVQPIESVRTFAGQTVTFSLWAKASTGTPKIGVAADQNFGSGGSTQVTTSGGTATISTSWARYSFTIAVPSISGKTIGSANDALILWLFSSVGTTVSGSGYPAVGIQNVTIDTWGWQIEAGSTATDFQTATGTLQELAACQRYYQRWSSSQFSRAGFIYADSTTNAVFVDKMPVCLRTTPTLTFTNMTANGNAITAAAVASDLGTANSLGLNLTTSGVSANTVYQLYVAAAQTGIIAYDSEL